LLSEMRIWCYLILQAGLVPGSYVGMGNHGTGCFTTAPGVSLGKHSLLQLSLH